MQKEFHSLNYREAAELIGVPVGTVYCWVSLKKVPHFRISDRLVRFDRDELLEWIESKKVGHVANHNSSVFTKEDTNA